MRVLLPQRGILAKSFQFRLEIGVKEIPVRWGQLGHRFGSATDKCGSAAIRAAECASWQGLKRKSISGGDVRSFQRGQILVHKRRTL